MIKRTFEATLRAKLGQGKVLLLVGPRQVGKTTLVKKLLANRSHLFFDGDDPTVRALLETANTQTLHQRTAFFCGSKRLIDEIETYVDEYSN